MITELIQENCSFENRLCRITSVAFATSLSSSTRAGDTDADQEKNVPAHRAPRVAARSMNRRYYKTPDGPTNEPFHSRCQHYSSPLSSRVGEALREGNFSLARCDPPSGAFVFSRYQSGFSGMDYSRERSCRCHFLPRAHVCVGGMQAITGRWRAKLRHRSVNLWSTLRIWPLERLLTGPSRVKATLRRGHRQPNVHNATSTKVSHYPHLLRPPRRWRTAQAAGVPKFGIPRGHPRPRRTKFGIRNGVPMARQGFAVIKLFF